MRAPQLSKRQAPGMITPQHPRMERERRAKQFMPFDALYGFREALAEKERIPAARKEFSEEKCEELDQKLRRLKAMDWVTIEYYSHGAYVWAEGFVTKIDLNKKILQIADTEIPFCDLSDLQGAFWPEPGKFDLSPRHFFPELGQSCFSGHSDRFDPLSAARIPELKEQPDQFIGIKEGKDSQKRQVQHHAGDPGGGHADGKQTGKLQHGTEH